MTPTLSFISLAMIGPFQVLLLFIPMIIAIVPLIFFLLTVQNTFKQISEENRQMQPGEVWLAIIPFFGLIWNFFIVSKLADSLRLEFDKRKIEEPEQRPGYGVGIAFSVLFASTILPFFGLLAGFAGFICWIVYWVRVDFFKRKLEAEWDKYNS